MATLSVSVEEVVYQVEQSIPTINLYKVIYSKGAVEMTRNRFSGEWKIVSRIGAGTKLPLKPIVKAIEENLAIIN